MSATTRSLTRQRARQGQLYGPLLAAGLAAALFVLGVLGHPAMPWPLNALGLSACAALAALQIMRARRAAGPADVWAEGAACALALVCAFGAQRALGGALGGLYPAVYVALVLLVALSSRGVGAALVALAVALELGAQWLGTAQGEGFAWLAPSLARLDGAALGRAGFLVAFGAIAHLVHGAEILERRRRHQREITEERANLVREARAFRLIHSGRVWEAAAASRERAEQLIMTDALEAVHHSTYVSLRLLKTSLACHTCVLLWFDGRGEALAIKELVSDADALVEVPIDPARGAIGGITRRREPVNLRDLKRGYRGLAYYREAQHVSHFLGVPVIEQGHLRGVLCVDRMEGDPFDAQDVDMLEEAAAYILRAVQNERLFTSIEKSKYELSRFFDASRRLNSVLTPEDVWREALACVAEITPFDVAAFTTYDAAAEVHTITRVERAPDWRGVADEWGGRTFEANAGWVSMVIKNRHYLPYNGQVRDAHPLVFSREERLDGLQSMLVLPLIAQDEVLGTLVVGHREPSRYTNDRREMLEVISHQVAVSLLNANLYARMEHMATRDALTGLPNRRTFLNRIEEAEARHRRSGGSFGVLLTDIDHFKSVNDTYGHSVGDEVLRQVSATFRECLRETDLPARWGGEEFIVLLEETDLEGCMVLADRLRQAVSELTFQSEQGPFQCTISMGVGMWPGDHEDLEELIDLADQALYHSKEHGRDRVTAYCSL